jgi:hypothetical protein
MTDEHGSHRGANGYRGFKKHPLLAGRCPASCILPCGETRTLPWNFRPIRHVNQCGIPAGFELFMWKLC